MDSLYQMPAAGLVRMLHCWPCSFSHRLCTSWRMWPASATACRAPAASRHAGCSWQTSVRWATCWRRSTTARPPCGSVARASWSLWTTASTCPHRRTWSTSTPARTIACVMRPPARWARRAACATRPRRAWMGASWCAADGATTNSRAFRWSVATASSIGAVTSSVKNAQRSLTSTSVNEKSHQSNKSILYKSI